jgi:hypothetical protein
MTYPKIVAFPPEIDVSNAVHLYNDVTHLSPSANNRI